MSNGIKSFCLMCKDQLFKSSKSIPMLPSERDLQHKAQIIVYVILNKAAKQNKQKQAGSAAEDESQSSFVGD